MVKRRIERSRFETVVHKLNTESPECGIFSQYNVKVSAGGRFYGLLLRPEALNDLYILGAAELSVDDGEESAPQIIEPGILATLLDIFIFLYCL